MTCSPSFARIVTGRRSAAEWHQIHVSDQPNAESNGDDLIGRRPGDIV